MHRQFIEKLQCKQELVIRVNFQQQQQQKNEMI